MSTAGDGYYLFGSEIDLSGLFLASLGLFLVPFFEQFVGRPETDFSGCLGGGQPAGYASKHRGTL